MKKVCLVCYHNAMKYQAPEIFLKPLCIYAEQIAHRVEECEVHDWASSDVCCEILSWLDAKEGGNG